MVHAFVDEEGMGWEGTVYTINHLTSEQKKLNNFVHSVSSSSFFFLLLLLFCPSFIFIFIFFFFSIFLSLFLFSLSFFAFSRSASALNRCGQSIYEHQHQLPVSGMILMQYSSHMSLMPKPYSLSGCN